VIGLVLKFRLSQVKIGVGKGKKKMSCKKPPTTTNNNIVFIKTCCKCFIFTFKDRDILNTCGTHLRAVLRTSYVYDSSKKKLGDDSFGLVVPRSEETKFFLYTIVSKGDIKLRKIKPILLNEKQKIIK